MSAFTAWPLQVSIYNLLKGNPLITDMVPESNIADWIKEGTQPPYIMSGDSAEQQGVLDTKDQQGVDHQFEILIVAQPTSIGANQFIKTLQKNIYDTLDRATITLSEGFILELRYQDSSTNSRENNKKVGTMTFTAITSS